MELVVTTSPLQAHYKLTTSYLLIRGPQRDWLLLERTRGAPGSSTVPHGRTTHTSRLTSGGSHGGGCDAADSGGESQMLRPSLSACMCSAPRGTRRSRSRLRVHARPRRGEVEHQIRAARAAPPCGWTWLRVARTWAGWRGRASATNARMATPVSAAAMHSTAAQAVVVLRVDRLREWQMIVRNRRQASHGFSRHHTQWRRQRRRQRGRRRSRVMFERAHRNAAGARWRARPSCAREHVLGEAVYTCASRLRTSCQR